MQGQFNPWFFINNPNIQMMGNGMNNNFINQPMNFGGNFNWTDGYTAAQNQNQNTNNDYNQNQDMGKMNFVFKTSTGNKPVNILFDRGQTVEELIKTFFKRVDREELFQNGGVTFIHNATPIDFHEKSNIEVYFKSRAFSIIMVIDINNLIGAENK